MYATKAIWTGFSGAPGYTTFHWQDLTTDTARNAAGAAMRAFFQSINGLFQTVWTITVQPEIQEYDMMSGALVGAAVMTTPPAPVNGGGAAGVYAGGSGACITWSTGAILNGRRVRGRTFIVPMVGSLYDTDGTLSAGVSTTLVAAGNTLIGATGAEFAVWGRRYSKATPPTVIGATIAPVTACTVKDMASQLRSRRL